MNHEPYTKAQAMAAVVINELIKSMEEKKNEN